MKLQDGRELMPKLSGTLRRFHMKVLVGDRVTLGLSPYDLSHGVILRRERLVTIALAASGGCSLIIGAFYGGPAWALAAVSLVWGFFVVADSGQFSTLVTEVAPRHAVGTALTLQTSLGFLLTVVTMQLVPWIAGIWGWRWAFVPLALGPVFGIASIARLARVRREAASRSLAAG